MFPDLEFIKTMLNGLRSRIEKVEDWAVSTDQVTQAVADYFVENPIVESDPTVPAWAKEPTKPTYTTAEIGAQPDMYVAYFSDLIAQLVEKPVVYVANADSTSPIPSGRYPVLLVRSGIDRGMADIVAYDAAGKTWAGSVNFVRGKIALVERTLTASDIGAIPTPAAASVGQVVAVKAVDVDGKPTAWEAVDISCELIASETLTESAATVEFTGLNLGVGSYTIIIRNTGKLTGAGLSISLNGITKSGFKGSFYDADGINSANISVLGSYTLGIGCMSNGGKNEYMWDLVTLPITSISVFSPYHLTDETKYFSAGTVVEIYRGVINYNM